MSKVMSGTAYWASVIAPNTKFDADGVWTIDVGNLDDLNKKKAQKDGLTIKNKGDEKEDFVTFKRKVRNAKGNLNRQPNVVDANKRLITETMIGNGSKVNVLYEPFEWNFGGKTGVSADLRAVQVTELVPYTTEEDDAFTIVPDGFTSDEAEDIPFSA
jgi:hypothetical protein|tara:strand:- start:2606 stop:3079 length:474 start_codon:yes stop_codon:yes gene_type:complete